MPTSTPCCQQVPQFAKNPANYLGSRPVDFILPSIFLLEKKSQTTSKTKFTTNSKMGYHVNLPPRYVQQIACPGERAMEVKHEKSRRRNRSRRTVHFNENANKTIVVSRLYKPEIWYNHLDFIGFEHNWKQKHREPETPRKTKKRPLLLGERSIPPLEDFQTFRSEACESRKRLVGSVLDHQASCKAAGYTDPDGYSIISKALSKSDRKVAWRAAAVNDYEVACFRKEMGRVSVSSLFVEYYLTAIQPHLSDPLGYLTKVLLCQCD